MKLTQWEKAGKNLNTNGWADSWNCRVQAQNNSHRWPSCPKRYLGTPHYDCPVTWSYWKWLHIKVHLIFFLCSAECSQLCFSWCKKNHWCASLALPHLLFDVPIHRGLCLEAWMDSQGYSSCQTSSGRE